MTLWHRPAGTMRTNTPPRGAPDHCIPYSFPRVAQSDPSQDPLQPHPDVRPNEPPDPLGRDRLLSAKGGLLRLLRPLLSSFPSMTGRLSWSTATLPPARRDPTHPTPSLRPIQFANLPPQSELLTTRSTGRKWKVSHSLAG